MTDLMKQLLDGKKHESLLMTPIKQMLLNQTAYDGGRRWDVLHPSELANSSFCDLAAYYRLSGWERPKESNAFQLEVIFAQGHGYHDKYQDWAWRVGEREGAPWGLRGRYSCLLCGNGDPSEGWEPWIATSPIACAKCGAARKYLRYREVGIHLPKYNIHGSADGDLDLGPDVPIEKHPLIEVKSVGEGTVRYTAPKLIQKHTKTVEINGESRKWTDWQAVWRDIKRPFKPHLKQGAIYCLGAGRERMLYVYEFKPTGAVKEFDVKVDFKIIEQELETALDIMYAVEKQRPPDCPHGGCSECRAYEELRHGAPDAEEERPEGREDQEPGASEGAAEEEGTQSPSASRGRAARGASRTRRPLRRGPDGGTSRAHRVDELPRRRARSRRDNRGVRTDDLRASSDRDDAPPRADQGRDDDRAQGTRRVVRRRAGR